MRSIPPARDLLPTLARLALAITIAGALPLPAHAQWPSDPAQNLPVCVEPGVQAQPALVADGEGGVFVFWADERPVEPGLYAQHLDRLGYAQWGAGGTIVTHNLVEWTGAAVGDGAGGAIVAWAGAADVTGSAVFAQRLSPAGAPGWGSNGVTVSTGSVASTGSGSLLAMAPGETGGAVLAWRDAASFVPVQRLDAAGQRAWASEVPLGDGSLMSRPQVANDGAGGSIVAWTSLWHVRAQRVDATGMPRWGASGHDFSGAGGGCRPNLVGDGSGGAVASWIGFFTAQPYLRLLAQRLDSLGAERWAAGGVAVVPTFVDQSDSLLADGAGGAFIAWLGSGLRVQHLGPDGAPLWDPAGVALAPWALRATQVLAPGRDGGVVVAWSDTGPKAQSVPASGSPLWGAGGVALTTSGSAQGWVSVASDGQGGLLSAWLDTRNEGLMGGDIYAQRVSAGGTLDVAPPPRAPSSLALAAGPVPARRGEPVTLRLTLPEAAPARVAIHDLSGRLVRALVGGAFAAGPRAIRWDGRDRDGRRVGPGLYFARAEAGGRTITARIVVTD